MTPAVLTNSIFTRNATRPLIIDSSSGASLSYREVAQRAAGLASRLESFGLKRGDRIGIRMPNGVEFALIYFACLLGGFVAVPVNSALAPNNEVILQRARLSALIVDERLGNAALTDLRFMLLSSNALFEDSPSADDATVAIRLSRVDGDDLFSIHFTSGTTSLPKSVPHRVGALLSNALSFVSTCGLGSERRFVHVMPMDYMAGFLNTLLCPLMAESSVIVLPQFSAASALKFWDPIVRHCGDTIWMSPTMLATLVLVDRGSAGIGYCRTSDIRILSATAPLPLKVRTEFEAKYGVDPVESYGLSELLLLTVNAGPAGSKAGSAGRFIPEAEVEIRDDAGSILPRNIDGKIFVRTPFASVGYLDLDSGSPVAPSSNWFDTGDGGHVDGDGYLFVTGRHKDLIIRGGFNVNPREIEEVLLRHPSVVNVAVVGTPHDYYGEAVVAAVIPKLGIDLATFEGELHLLCRNDLPTQAVPDRFIGFTSFPVTQTGKVQKNKVRDQIMGTQL